MANTCARCSAPATATYAGCHQCPSLDLTTEISTYYCSVYCRQYHRRAHQEKCEAARDRKIFEIVCGVIREAILTYRSHTFEWPLDWPVKRVGSELHYHSDSSRSKKSPTGVSYTLPEWWSKISSQDRESLLSHNICEESLVVADQLFQVMLRHLMPHDTPVLVSSNAVKGMAFMMRAVLPDGNVFGQNSGKFHAVARIKLRSGDEYALDISAAQYGWSDWLLTWDRFCSQRCDYNMGIQTIPQLRRRIEHLYGGNLQPPVLKKQRLMHSRLDAAMRPFFASHPIPTPATSDTKALEDWLDEFLGTWEQNVITLEKLIDPICFAKREDLPTVEQRKAWDEYNGVQTREDFRRAMISSYHREFGVFPNLEEVGRKMAEEGY
ncbi:hypothetical protein CAC42_3374 [Sphaceloma murrayae]|uniref:MYND-type zinc finger protein samB n=1 Tax=Sphaceloma murrayae TaxID=2082308 RepID=A0A2K1R176_9PEZI|nr:hypothetical protein CAC42_3374 [Sphaceloma murrayae]